MKASELIKNECCGIGLLSVEKAELVKKVETIEAENNFLKSQLDNALAKIQELSK